MATIRRLTGFACLILSALLFSECKSDSIPSTLSEPYLFDAILFGNGTLPPPGATLLHGPNAVLHLNVAYTLSPGLSANRNNLALYLQAFGRDSANTAWQVRSGVQRDSFFLAQASAGVIRDSLTISIPSYIRSVKVQAFIDSIPFRNPVVLIDSASWPVQ